jgi:hypothetical protein
MKRQSIKWEKIPTNHLSHKGLQPRTYIKKSQHLVRKQNNLTFKIDNRCESILPNKIKDSIKTHKDIQHH